MALRLTVREKYFVHNTLLSVIKGLEGEKVVVDLINEHSVLGTITHVDGYMNLDLEKATFCSSKGDTIPFEAFFVQSRNIRYVQLPHNKTAEELIAKGIASIAKPKRPNKTPHTFKKSRAQKYQQQILQELAAQQKN